MLLVRGDRAHATPPPMSGFGTTSGLQGESLSPLIVKIAAALPTLQQPNAVGEALRPEQVHRILSSALE
jgi:hypothetical protein